MDEFKNNENNLRNYENESIDYTKEIIDCTNSDMENDIDNFENNIFSSPVNQSQDSQYSQNDISQDNVIQNDINLNAVNQNDINQSIDTFNTLNGSNSFNNDIRSLLYNDSQEDDKKEFITIKSSDFEDKKDNKKFKKIFKTASILAVCCASIGIGIGIGFNSSEKYIAKNEGSGFVFPETASSDDITIEDNNIILTGTNTIAPIINKVKDSVVNISIKSQTTNFFNQVYESTGAGSGIIYDQDDEKVYIVTNNHVVEGANSVQISITGNEQVPASLAGKDASSDLALIYVLKSDLAAAGINEVKAAVFADSDQMEVGEYVLAVGNALGEGKTVTQGIISAQNKEINIDGKKLTVLQTDAAINPGNSGGALINTDGEVVGINTAKLSSSSVEGVGYAIPSSYAKSIVNELRQNGTIERPYLGIVGFTINDNFKRTYNIDIDGVFLTSIEEGSAAYNAGLKRTDIITGFNGNKITTIEELSAAISACKANDTVSINVIRNGVTEMTITATLNNYNQQF